MNPYLAKLREKHAAMQSSIEGILTRAAAADADLTEDELRSVKDQGAAADKVAGEIEMLTAQENRAAAVAELGATLRTTSATSSTTTKDRDPGHYRSAVEGGQHSFFGDLFRAKVLHEDAPGQRIIEHSRSLNSAGVTGVVPPEWISSLYTELAQQDAQLYSVASKYPIADARIIQLPGQTGSTVVGSQSSENAVLTDGNAYAATAVNITPTTIVGRETVSRQLLDASDPRIDQLILGDLTASYVASRENLIGTSIRGVGSAYAFGLTVFKNMTNANSGYSLAVQAQMAVRKARFRRPTAFAMDYDLYTNYMNLLDSQGRPVLVNSGAGPFNAVGVNSPQGGSDGWIAGVPVVVSAGMKGGTATSNYGAMVEASSVLCFESPQMTFRFEEVAGPQSIQLGLWRYFAVAVRQGTTAVKNMTIDTLT